jgi:FtsP/CotA-like multicopper oxidase with cupredoxin domain
MKNTIAVITIITITALMAIAGCKKHNNDMEEQVPVATLVIISPAEGASYAYGDSVAIVATGISNALIHGYDLTIRKANDSAVYYFAHIDEHNDTLAISKKWKDTLTTAADLEVVIRLVLDHDGHVLTKKAGFRAR